MEKIPLLVTMLIYLFSTSTHAASFWCKNCRGIWFYGGAELGMTHDISDNELSTSANLLLGVELLPKFWKVGLGVEAGYHNIIIHATEEMRQTYIAIKPEYKFEQAQIFFKLGRSLYSTDKRILHFTGKDKDLLFALGADFFLIPETLAISTQYFAYLDSATSIHSIGLNYYF